VSNNQPWNFIVVREVKRMESCLSSGNRWALRAAAIIAVISRERDDIMQDGKPYYLFDCGLAAENLVIHATSLGLVAHMMLGFNERATQIALTLGSEYRVICLIALGYPSTSQIFDEKSRLFDQNPRPRRPLRELVSWETWKGRCMTEAQSRPWEWRDGSSST
jgi:nitroreductase